VRGGKHFLVNVYFTIALWFVLLNSPPSFLPHFTRLSSVQNIPVGFGERFSEFFDAVVWWPLYLNRFAGGQMLTLVLVTVLGFGVLLIWVPLGAMFYSASTMPDEDSVEGGPGRLKWIFPAPAVFFKLAETISPNAMKHRRLAHSLLFWATTSILNTSASYFMYVYLLRIIESTFSDTQSLLLYGGGAFIILSLHSHVYSIAYLFHIIADTVTYTGVPILYPLKLTVYGSWKAAAAIALAPIAYALALPMLGESFKLNFWVHLMDSLILSFQLSLVAVPATWPIFTPIAALKRRKPTVPARAWKPTPQLNYPAKVVPQPQVAAEPSPKVLEEEARRREEYARSLLLQKARELGIKVEEEAGTAAEPDSSGKSAVVQERRETEAKKVGENRVQPKEWKVKKNLSTVIVGHKPIQFYQKIAEENFRENGRITLRSEERLAWKAKKVAKGLMKKFPKTVVEKEGLTPFEEAVVSKDGSVKKVKAYTITLAQKKE
jgi:hypothetical protein